MAFTRMDQSTAEDWQVIGQATYEWQRSMPDRMLDLLRQLKGVEVGFGVDQYHHALQTAAMAERAGASDEVVVAALFHDVGKAISILNHAAIAAEILKPFISDDLYHVVLTHQDFQGEHYYEYFGGDPRARDQYRGEPWYDLAVQFTDEWDQTSFDPDFVVPDAEHFRPVVERVIGMKGS